MLLLTVLQLMQRHAQHLQLRAQLPLTAHVQQLRAHVRQTSQLTARLPQLLLPTAAQPMGSQNSSTLARSAQQQQQQ
jgi:hypothetical protein